MSVIDFYSSTVHMHARMHAIIACMHAVRAVAAWSQRAMTASPLHFILYAPFYQFSANVHDVAATRLQASCS